MKHTTPTQRTDQNPPPSVRFGLGLLVGLMFSVQSATAEPIHPVPLNPDVDLAKAELGRRLFHDTRLSKDNTISCASCHDLSAGGDDGGERLPRHGGAD